MDLSPQSIENTVQRITLKDTSPSMSCIPEPAIQSCDNGQRIPFLTAGNLPKRACPISS